jgi:hypothetical protein
MGWLHLDSFARVGLDPSTVGAATGEHQHMFAVVIAYGQLDVAIEWRVGSGLPGPGF